MQMVPSIDKEKWRIQVYGVEKGRGGASYSIVRWRRNGKICSLLDHEPVFSKKVA